MSLNEYYAEKTVSWNGVTVGLAIWILAFAALIVAENLDHVTARMEKSDRISVQLDEGAVLDRLTDKEYHLLNCKYCE